LFPGVSPQHMVLADAADNQNLLSDENRFRPALLYSAQRAISNNKARAIVVAARYARALCIAGASVMAGTGFRHILGGQSVSGIFEPVWRYHGIGHGTSWGGGGGLRGLGIRLGLFRLISLLHFLVSALANGARQPGARSPRLSAANLAAPC
jgi:hypothetical protein